MSGRTCDKCGGRTSPHIPRTRVGDELWCAGCAVNHRPKMAGWSPEDAVRYETGRQQVHTVNGGTQLCPEHLQGALARADFANGVAAQAGLPHSYDKIDVSEAHEGRCAECERGQEGMPWMPPARPGQRPVHEERQPTPHGEGFDADEDPDPRARWPYRPLRDRTERHVPVEHLPYSLNSRTAAGEHHPDILANLRLFGCHHTHGGRCLPAPKLAASQEEQESRLADESGWRHEHTRFQPVRFAIEGARAYNSKVGLGDPHEHDYDHIKQDRDTVRTVGRAYDALPEHQDHALPHFEAMRREVGQQYHHLTHTMGVNVQTVDHDPYANVHELVHDVNTNKRLKVLGTHVTGGHPYFSDHENDQFRAVHDFFGHAATGRDFSRHGEQAAFLAHARMFSHHALPAMTSETKGQNTSLILNGHFGPQKIALLPKEHWDHSWPSRGAARVMPDGRVAVVVRQGYAITASIEKLAHDSGDGETLFHCPFCGSGQIIARSDGTTECEFCNTAFTVQVQPQMPAFPQTVDGQPIDVPGMPNGGKDANVPPGAAPRDAGNPMDPNADPNDPNAQGLPEDGEDGGDDAPFDKSADDGGDASGDDDEKPAFLKGSMLYRTASGHAVTETQYMRHLALTYGDRESVLEQVRRENAAR